MSLKFSRNIFIIIFIIFCSPIDSLAKKNNIEAFFLNDLNINRIFPIDKKKIISKRIDPKKNNLLIKPGYYFIKGSYYDLRKEGLYRFSNLYKSNLQIIVFEENVHSLMSSLAWIITQGTLDNNVNNYFQLSRISSTRKLSLTCGQTVQFALDMLNELGIKSRQISLFALNNINNMSDGHVMIEVYRKDLNKWVLYDLSNNSFFQNKSIDALSMYEFHESFQDDDLVIKEIAKDSLIDTSSYNLKNYNNSLFYENLITTNTQRMIWYKKILELPAIYSNGIYFTPKKLTKLEKKYFNSLFDGNNPNLKIMKEENFKSYFYR